MNYLIWLLIVSFICSVFSEASFAHGLTSKQRRTTDQIISFFENKTVEIQYGYAEKLGDGRGITCGRAGFTTATSDAFLVVERYLQKKPNAPIGKYLPELARLHNLADDQSEQKDDVSHLEDFETAWADAAQDETFRDVQDQIVEELYYRPAMLYANQNGLKKPLSMAVLYETIIQHGGGRDPDSLEAIIEKTNQKSGGNPASGADEKKWLDNFLEIRKSVLLDPHNAATAEEWIESAPRADVWMEIAKSGNYELKTPIKFTVFGDTAEIR